MELDDLNIGHSTVHWRWEAAPTLTILDMHAASARIHSGTSAPPQNLNFMPLQHCVHGQAQSRPASQFSVWPAARRKTETDARPSSLHFIAPLRGWF